MNKLSQYLNLKKVNQAEFAKRVGTTQATVSRLASGLQNPSIKLARKIEAETDGSVSVTDWPQYAAIIAPPSDGEARP